MTVPATNKTKGGPATEDWFVCGSGCRSEGEVGHQVTVGSFKEDSRAMMPGFFFALPSPRLHTMNLHLPCHKCGVTCLIPVEIVYCSVMQSTTISLICFVFIMFNWRHIPNNI